VQERGTVAALTKARARQLPAVSGIAAAVVVLDQLTKEWALRALSVGPVHLVWTLRLNLSINSGAAFGLGRGLGPVLVVAALGVVVVLVFMVRSVALGRWGVMALGLVLGGALGNLADRLFRGHGGVVDFIDLQWWPIFNVADAAISVGALVLALSARER
jgi:signal peptidase II